MRPLQTKEPLLLPGVRGETILPGQAATLQWKAVRADRANLDDQTVPPTGGTLAVTPAATTSYTLMVENELGRTRQTVQVAVVNLTPTATP